MFRRVTETSDARLPLHAQAQDDLGCRIRAGEWGHSSPLPAETELARQYGVSLGTIRRVLAELTSQGLIERHQGRGTFVRRARFDRSLSRFFRAGDTVPDSQILSRERVRPPQEVSASLGGPQQVLRLDRLRLVDGTPQLVELIHLPLPAFEALAEVELGEIGNLLYPAYEHLAGQVVSSATEELTVTVADPGLAQHFRCDVGDPVVRVERVARAVTGRALEHRVSYGLASRFRYRTEIA